MNSTVTLLDNVSSFNRWDYTLVGFWRENCDPYSAWLPGIAMPWVTLITIGLYLDFVKRWGPANDGDKPAYELRGPMLVYNTFMVVINAYFLYKSVGWLDYGRELFNFNFPPVSQAKMNSPEGQDFVWSFYLYWLSKFVDLLDTIFFVLRKKQKQISVLHVYHHSAVPILGWMNFWYRFGCPAISLFALLNSTVHVIMYSYYALAAMGPWIQPYLWWKKYITQVQLIQFAILISYSIAVCTLSNYPSAPFLVASSQPLLFFAFFWNFYSQNYPQKSKVDSLKKHQE